MTPRSRYLEKEVLHGWWEATVFLPTYYSNGYFDGDTFRDYFQFLLLTGMRRDEAKTKLTWSGIDFKNRSLFVGDTKNGGDLLIPMSDYIETMLISRFKTACDLKPMDKVFAGVDPQRCTKAVAAITAARGVQIHRSPHDFRRTFITYGEEVATHHIVKTLVNHRKPRGDVTVGYNQGFHLDALREPMQKISNHILSFACVGGSENV